MRALIMAAGVASRFKGISKPFLKIQGEPIVERMIKQLHGYGINQIYVVVGHQSELFESLSTEVTLIPNPDYQHGDNAQGLKIALDAIGYADTLILDADLVLPPGALLPLLDNYNQYHESVSLIDPDFDDPEAMKVVVKEGRIVEYSKEHGYGAEVCTIVTSDALQAIYEDLDHLKWWGVGVSEGKLRPRVAPIASNAKWIEIDTPEDYERAKELFPDVSEIKTPFTYQESKL